MRRTDLRRVGAVAIGVLQGAATGVVTVLVLAVLRRAVLSGVGGAVAVALTGAGLAYVVASAGLGALGEIGAASVIGGPGWARC